jgi:DNA-binding NtrC family response regulator
MTPRVEAPPISSAKILLVDDEVNVRFALRETLESIGCRCWEAGDGNEAINIFRQGAFDLIILDYRMPGLDGIETLREIRRMDADVPVLFVTAYGSKELALEALQEGAYDYFTKPFDNEEMKVVVHRALEKSNLKQRLVLFTKQMDASVGFDQLIGSTSEMREVYQMIQKVASQDVTVLVLGESGTGKELVATAIHRHSHRRNGPFVPINCAAIPESLLESELFGHEKGSFTGANNQKIGRFEQAHGGTIFLDEIGDMDALLQAKILRILQDHQFQRVGGTRTLAADVRVVAATNINLVQAVAEGKFREDLYFRLNVIPIFLPPLRERRSDLSLLIDHFLRKANNQFSKSVTGLSPEVLQRLMDYHWPGNIRELQNVISRAVVLSHGPVITDTDLPLGFISSRGSADGTNHNHTSERISSTSAQPGIPDVRERILARIRDGKSLEEAIDDEVFHIEKDVIVTTLEANHWKRGESARILGMSRRNLLRKMQKLEIE